MIQVVLLDIEGTTTPISFVYDVLFPYARKALGPYLKANFSAKIITEAVELLWEENNSDLVQESDCPSLEREWESVNEYCLWLMDRDRKSRGLKILQGLIWKDGYDRGELKGEIYDDVLPALEHWKEDGKTLCIYSSGSVLAQKLLFSHTTHGDLTGKFDCFFDTSTGGKKEPESYRKICASLGVQPSELFFLTDNPDEVRAAKRAGCGVLLVERDQKTTEDSISSFANLEL